MSVYHATLSQGRADTLYLHAVSKSKVLSFLNLVSTAVVRNIKKVLYSEDLNINEIGFVRPHYSVPVPVYHRVVFTANTKNYSKTFTLFNVIKPTTSTALLSRLKNLCIKEEPILNISSVQFYNETVPDTYTDNLYQVQYVRNSKTYVEDFYSNSITSIRDLFTGMIDGKITEIRKYEHLDQTVKKDDGDYVKRVSVYVSSGGDAFFISLPKVKKNLKPDSIKSYIKTELNFYDKPIVEDSIKLTLR